MKPVMSPVQNEDDSYIFWCPACECAHGINSRWQFDGDLVTPTISPSLLSQGEHRCHLFVKKGKIQYLSDCTHDLAAQTIDMEPLPWEDKASS